MIAARCSICYPVTTGERATRATFKTNELLPHRLTIGGGYPSYIAHLNSRDRKLQELLPVIQVRPGSTIDFDQPYQEALDASHDPVM